MIIDISLLLIAILTISNICVSILYFQSLIRLKQLTQKSMDLFFNNLKIEEDFKLNQTEDSDTIHRENFIKFLSDSRDWAFDYIDKVQKELKDFIEIADKQFSYFDSYGILTQEYPNYETMKVISEEYKKLKSLLPEETDDRR